MENCSQGIVLDSAIKSDRIHKKAEKEDNMELSSRGSQVNRSHPRPFRFGEPHEVLWRRVLRSKQTELLRGA